MTTEQPAAQSITVALHGYFSQRYSGRQRPVIVPLAEAVTPRAVVARLGLPLGALGLVLINNQQATLDTPLHDGDRLDILPLLGGG